jgi:hypothetical protein
MLQMRKASKYLVQNVQSICEQLPLCAAAGKESFFVIIFNSVNMSIREDIVIKRMRHVILEHSSFKSVEDLHSYPSKAALSITTKSERPLSLEENISLLRLMALAMFCTMSQMLVNVLFQGVTLLAYESAFHLFRAVVVHEAWSIPHEHRFSRNAVAVVNLQVQPPLKIWNWGDNQNKWMTAPLSGTSY